MDKARPFEYVYRLTANTIEELAYGEAVYDRQVLLNESWQSYAVRSGKTDEVDNERTKWITRTWDEQELMRTQQRQVLLDAAVQGEREIAAKEEKLKRRMERSKKTVEHLMEREECLHSARIPCRHNLFVDFDDFQQLKFNLERNVVAMGEYFLRVFWSEGQDYLFEGLLIMGEYDRIYFSMRLNERLRREEEQRQRLEEERLKAIEEEKRQEEIRQRAQEEAERLRREALDQAKIIERKRREEERRARARATREKSKQRAPCESQTADVAPQQNVVRADTTETNENSSVNDAKTSQKYIEFQFPVGEGHQEKIRSGCSILTVAGDVCCVLEVNKKHHSSICVCQNGVWRQDTAGSDDSNLLGCTFGDETSLIFTSEKLHGSFHESLEGFCASRVECATGGDFKQFCTKLNPSSSLDESLILLPLQKSSFETFIYVFVICRKAGSVFHQREVEAAARVVWELTKMVYPESGTS